MASLCHQESLVAHVGNISPFHNFGKAVTTVMLLVCIQYSESPGPKSQAGHTHGVWNSMAVSWPLPKSFTKDTSVEVTGVREPWGSSCSPTLLASYPPAHSIPRTGETHSQALRHFSSCFRDKSKQKEHLERVMNSRLPLAGQPGRQ